MPEAIFQVLLMSPNINSYMMNYKNTQCGLKRQTVRILSGSAILEMHVFVCILPHEKVDNTGIGAKLSLGYYWG